jgi:hypothetical protein
MITGSDIMGKTGCMGGELASLTTGSCGGVLSRAGARGREGADDTGEDSGGGGTIAAGGGTILISATDEGAGYGSAALLLGTTPARAFWV